MSPQKAEIRQTRRIIKNENSIHHEKLLSKLLIILVSQRGREFCDTKGFNRWPDCYIVGIYKCELKSQGS